MDRALVENAENDIDDHKRSCDQNRGVGERRLKCLSIPLETRGDGSRLSAFLLELSDGIYGFAKGYPRSQIERDRGRGEHPLMVDHDRSRLDITIDQRAQRHLLVGR